MIDYFALALTHGLILIALVRLVGQKELDEDPNFKVRRKKRPAGQRGPQETALNQKPSANA